jgi:hypothetical protein
MYPDKNFAAQVVPICLLVGLILLQVWIQFRVLRKLAIFLKT